jgi:hypothetical protein
MYVEFLIGFRRIFRPNSIILHMIFFRFNFNALFNSLSLSRVLSILLGLIEFYRPLAGNGDYSSERIGVRRFSACSFSLRDFPRLIAFSGRVL